MQQNDDISIQWKFFSIVCVLYVSLIFFIISCLDRNRQSKLLHLLSLKHATGKNALFLRILTFTKV